MQQQRQRKFLRARPDPVDPNRARRHWSLWCFRLAAIPIPLLASVYFDQQADNLDHGVSARTDGEPVTRTLQIIPRDGIASERGAQIVEFAVALPLLVVFVVGIFDFSNAFTLKQRLTNVARDAARAAASDPANDLQGASGGTNPVSVTDAFYIVDNYLLANNLTDCGITSTATVTSLTWTFTASGNGCVAPGLTIIVNRGYYFPAVGGTAPSPTCVAQASGGQIAVVSTCVSIQYAYPWRFGRAASLLGFGSALPPQISAVAVAANEN
jgi:Flp pilus assembly protein TadG